jgi:pilus assembly protein Flp/PilA
MLAITRMKALRLAADRHGVTAIEYALIASAIAIAIIGAVIVLGTDVSNLFTFTSDQIKTVPLGK